ncbi:hypothetical protein [Dyadobacter bucti]|uniref:hypothetical protein n=1 Tax=Dyadobacter bucti TaxID=2572203 RepID=UPI001109C2CE|nr:hypothetical protein [Dyadobacter bucti]
MRKLTLLFLLFWQITYAQVKEYQEFDIKGTSGNVFRLITQDVSSNNPSDYSDLVKAKQRELLKKVNLSDPGQRAAYGQYVSKALTSARALWQDKQEETILKVSPEYFLKFGNDALASYGGSNSSPFIDALLTPIIRSGFLDYAKDETKSNAKEILDDPQQLDSLMKYTVSYLQLQGVPIDANSDRLKIELKTISASVATTDQLKVYADPVLEIIVQEAQKRLKVVTTPKEWDANTITHGLKQNYNKVLLGTEKKTIEDFSELGQNVKELAINEIKIQDTVDELRKEWDQVQFKIVEKEKNIKEAIAGSSEFTLYQASHARLVVQNQLRLDIINGYVNKGVKVIETVNRLKNSVEKAFDPAERSAFLNKIQNFELPTLTAAISGADGVAGQLALAFPGNKSVQQVAKFTSYATKAVNIGMGVASIFTGNPLGVLSIMSGIGSLFGGPPPESPELQLLKQLREEMQNAFKEVNQRLERIEQKLDDLITMVQIMYKDMMRSFQLINDKLEDIDWKIDRLMSLSQTTVQLLANVSDCRTLYATYLKTQKIKPDFFSKYSGFDALHQADAGTCQKCLTGLKTHTNVGQDNLFSMDFTIPPTQLIPLVRERFGKTKDLFSKFYGKSPQAINGLYIPAKRIEDSQQAYLAVASISGLTDIDKAFDTFYNYALLTEFTDWIIDLSPYFLISTSADYKPLKLKEYFKVDDNVLLTKNSDLQTRLYLLLNYVNYGILQQSMLAGNEMMEDTYQVLFGYYPNDPGLQVAKLATEVLKNNKLMAKNFSSRLIYSNVNSEVRDSPLRYKEYASLFYDSITDDNKLAELNIKYSDANFDFVRADGYGNLMLHLNGRGNGINLPIADPAYVLSNEMAQSDGLYALMRAKGKIISKLTDLAFPSQLPSQDIIAPNDMKYFYAESNTLNPQ